MSKMKPCPFCGSGDIEISGGRFGLVYDEESIKLYKIQCNACLAMNSRQTKKIAEVGDVKSE